MATRECHDREHRTCVQEIVSSTSSAPRSVSPPSRSLRHAALGLDRRHLEFGCRNGATVVQIGKHGVFDLPKPDALAVLVRVLAALRM